MLNHVELIKFKSGVSQEDIDAFEEDLDILPNNIVEIQVYEFGRDVTGSNRSYDFAIVSLFANSEALNRYRVHPDYQAAFDKIG